MKLNIIVKKIGILIALVFVMGAIAQSALNLNKAELGEVQWRDRRYFHWFNKYYGARCRSRWPDLGDPRPCSRREAEREHPA